MVRGRILVIDLPQPPLQQNQTLQRRFSLAEGLCHLRISPWLAPADGYSHTGLKGRNVTAQGNALGKYVGSRLLSLFSLKPCKGETENAMPHSLARILVHLIFSTKDRAAVLAPDVRPDLRAYFVGILANLECPCLEVGGAADHMHVLFAMHRTRSVAEVVEEVKTGSSKWLKTRATALRNFGWQNGYGAFSVSPSSAARVIQYIRGQEQHHKHVTFEEEYRAFLRRHGVEFDERYVWD